VRVKRVSRNRTSNVNGTREREPGRTGAEGNVVVGQKINQVEGNQRVSPKRSERNQ